MLIGSNQNHIPWMRSALELKNIPAQVLMSRMLSRVGANQEFLYSTPPIELPDGAEEYLKAENPRLAEIGEEYLDAVRSSGFPSESLAWCDDRISADLPLKGFRGDCCYGWQKRDCNVPAAYILTWLYFREIGLGPTLERHSEDSFFGSFTVDYRGRKLSRDLLDSVCEISFVQRMLNKCSVDGPIDVLDIGSGYGRLAHRLSNETWSAHTI